MQRKYNVWQYSGASEIPYVAQALAENFLVGGKICAPTVDCFYFVIFHLCQLNKYLSLPGAVDPVTMPQVLLAAVASNMHCYYSMPRCMYWSRGILQLFSVMTVSTSLYQTLLLISLQLIFMYISHTVRCVCWTNVSYIHIAQVNRKYLDSLIPLYRDDLDQSVRLKFASCSIWGKRMMCVSTSSGVHCQPKKVLFKHWAYAQQFQFFFYIYYVRTAEVLKLNKLNISLLSTVNVLMYCV